MPTTNTSTFLNDVINPYVNETNDAATTATTIFDGIIAANGAAERGYIYFLNLHRCVSPTAGQYPILF